MKGGSNISNQKIQKLLLIGLVFVLIACGAKKKEVNLTKDGTPFEYANVSFIVPKQFKEESNLDSAHVKARFDNGDDSYLLLRIDEVLENNKEEELVELFRIEVESLGASIVSNAKVTLSNGDTCYEVVAKRGNEQIKYLVMFEEQMRYCLKYVTTTDQYDEQIIDMDKYLYTFTVKERGE